MIFNKNEIKRFTFTIIAFIFTVSLPLINYIIFKKSVQEGINIGNLEKKYDIVIILTIIIGLFSTTITYLIFHYPKFSIKRATLALTQSISDILFIVFFMQMGRIFISSEGSSIYLDITGIYNLMIIALAPFVFKNIFDLIDFKVNKIEYHRKLMFEIKKTQKEAQKHIKCPKCKYVCQKDWKRCPICKAKL